jgi:hypothetical protein
MTTISDLFPSKYLKAADAENDLVLTIAKISKEKLKNNDGEEEIKPVIYFSEHEKGVVLNKTNANILTDLFGETIEEWTGHKVTLCAVDVDAFGKIQKALRFRAEAPKVSRADLLKRYSKLFEECKKLGVEDIDTYAIPADASDATIVELGKALRQTIEAYKTFD